MIRLLNLEDAENYRRLRLGCLSDSPFSWLSTYEEELNFPQSFFINKLVTSISPPIFGTYGFFTGDKLLAYAQLASNYWSKKRHTINLFDVCVDKKVRRQKIGTKLIEHLIEKAKSQKFVEQIHLRVNSDNLGAIKFYKTLGFKKIGVLKDAIKNPDGSYQDEYLYCYYLKNISTS